jgi:hypothetical protein
MTTEFRGTVKLTCVYLEQSSDFFSIKPLSSENASLLLHVILSGLSNSMSVRPEASLRLEENGVLFCHNTLHTAGKMRTQQAAAKDTTPLD